MLILRLFSSVQFSERFSKNLRRSLLGVYSKISKFCSVLSREELEENAEVVPAVAGWEHGGRYSLGER
jgi:hypothetical protein